MLFQPRQLAQLLHLVPFGTHLKQAPNTCPGVARRNWAAVFHMSIDIYNVQRTSCAAHSRQFHVWSDLLHLLGTPPTPK